MMMSRCSQIRPVKKYTGVLRICKTQFILYLIAYSDHREGNFKMETGSLKWTVHICIAIKYVSSYPYISKFTTGINLDQLLVWKAWKNLLKLKQYSQGHSKIILDPYGDRKHLHFFPIVPCIMFHPSRNSHRYRLKHTVNSNITDWK